MTLILASNSPRCRQLLTGTGLPYTRTVRLHGVDEDFPLHRRRAGVADTIVCPENDVLNKPADRHKATMLTRLRAITRLEDYFNVMGLPTYRVWAKLEALGALPESTQSR